MTAILYALVTLGALALAAFCAGAETGFMSMRRGRLIHLVRAGGMRAKILQVAYQNLGRTTTALLVGNNLASVTFSSASAALSSVLFSGSPTAQSVWGAGAAFAILFFGEYTPKLLCSSRPLRRMLALSPVWNVFEKAFAPVGTVILRLIGRFIPKRDGTVRVTPDMVLKILADRKDGVKLSNLETALIRRILSLRAKGMFITPDTLLPALDDLS